MRYGKLKVDPSRIPGPTRLVPAQEFIARAEMRNKDIASVHLHNGHPFVYRTEDGRLYVDAGRIEAVQQFRRDLWNRAHEIYYELQRRGWTDMRMAAAIAARTGRKAGSWRSYISQQLFASYEMRPFEIEIPSMLAEFVYYGERILGMMERKDANPR